MSSETVWSKIFKNHGQNLSPQGCARVCKDKAEFKGENGKYLSGQLNPTTASQPWSPSGFLVGSGPQQGQDPGKGQLEKEVPCRGQHKASPTFHVSEFVQPCACDLKLKYELRLWSELGPLLGLQQKQALPRCSMGTVTSRKSAGSPRRGQRVRAMSLLPCSVPGKVGTVRPPGHAGETVAAWAVSLASQPSGFSRVLTDPHQHGEALASRPALSLLGGHFHLACPGLTEATTAWGEAGAGVSGWLTQPASTLPEKDIPIAGTEALGTGQRGF